MAFLAPVTAPRGVHQRRCVPADTVSAKVGMHGPTARDDAVHHVRHLKAGAGPSRSAEMHTR